MEAKDGFFAYKARVSMIFSYLRVKHKREQQVRNDSEIERERVGKKEITEDVSCKKI